VLPLIGSVRQMVEVVVLDMPYTFDDLYFEALSVADQIVLVARSSSPSVWALKVVAEAVAQRALGVTQHLVINRYGPQEEEFTTAELSKALSAQRIWTIANDPKAFEAAMKNGRSLRQESKGLGAWTGIAALANHIILGTKIPIAPKRTASWSTWVAALFRRAPPVANTAVAAQ
jgi:Flp pilus assembly CpaE family ATPase